MTDEEKRLSIAKACGWKFQEGTEPSYGGTNIPRGWLNPKTKRLQISLPDYPYDLNAMHEAEKHLRSIQGRQWLNYCDLLNTDRTSIHATAAQRAEAFLRTIGKWMD